jgi:hypothetical protein
MREGPFGVSSKSARHSPIEFTARKPQGIEQPHMPAEASSYMTRGYASGGFAVRVGAGALGFRDFSGLLAAKENRTGSRQTLFLIA